MKMQILGAKVLKGQKDGNDWPPTIYSFRDSAASGLHRAVFTSRAGRCHFAFGRYPELLNRIGKFSPCFHPLACGSEHFTYEARSGR